MSDRDSTQSVGWSAIGPGKEPKSDPFAAWDEVWRAQQVANREAEAFERAKMRREIRWMSGLIAAWSLVMGGAAALAIRILL